MMTLGFMEDGSMWARVWCMALGVGATAEEAGVAADLAQWAVRDAALVANLN